MFVDCDEHETKISYPMVSGAVVTELRKLGLPPGNALIIEGVYWYRGKPTRGSPPIRIFEFQDIE
jgi:hypothetical protein